MNPYDLGRKIVLITGANSGIGKETALEFAKENCIVVISYLRNKEEAHKIAMKCMDVGAREFFLVKMDVTKNKDIKNAMSKIIARYHHIDILVNNAGVIVWEPLMKQSFETITNQVNVNLSGLMKVTFEFLPHVRECIINIASRAGKIPHPGISVYCATKFGVRGFTQTLALEYPKLRIYAVNPDSTSTVMTNFLGRSPSAVAKVIVNAAKNNYDLKSGSDVDVWALK